MLLVDPAQRSQADKLLLRFQECERRAKANIEYIVEPRPMHSLAPETHKEYTIRGVLNPDTVRMDLDHEYNKARMSAKFSRASRFTQRSVRLKEVIQAPEIIINQETFEPPSLRPSLKEGIAQARDDNLPQQIPHLVRLVERKVRRAYREEREAQMTSYVSVEIAWELQQCIQEELEGSFDLGSVLTITGDASHSRAAPCLEYVQETWGSRGVQLLRDLEFYLQKMLRDAGKS